MLMLFNDERPDLDDFWAIASEPVLAKAIEATGGRYTPETVLRDIKAKRMQLWIVCDKTGTIYASLVTSVTRWPTGMTTCSVLFMGGHDMKRWITLVGTLKDWARSLGCSRLDYSGREGLERVLGWRRLGVMSETEL